jgi:hypothetical protein
MRCFFDRLDLSDEAAVGAIPRTSIDCIEILTLRPAEICRRAKAADRCFEIDTRHDLMISEPQATAELLLEITRVPANKR